MAGNTLAKNEVLPKAKEFLQNTLSQAEKLELLAVQTQAHVVLAKVYEQEKNIAEVEHEKKLMMQLFLEIQTQSHFDPRTRHDFAGLLP